MSDFWSEPQARVRARYRAELLVDAQFQSDGIWHGPEDARQLLAWSQIQRAHAAEVGEPEGVRTVVFDLVVGRGPQGWRVLRFDADPGERAMACARRLGQVLGPEKLSSSIKSVAADGSATRWYPDLESFELDASRRESA